MDYIKKLQNFNLKITPQRLEIVDILYKYGHINIDDLYQLLKKKYPSLSLATIYKNINIMCDKLFLSELKMANKKTLYELKKEEHFHLVCSKCNNIMDINLDASSLIKEAEKLSSFNLKESSIILNGICPKCLK